MIGRFSLILAVALAPDFAAAAGRLHHRHSHAPPRERPSSEEPYAGLRGNPYAGYVGPGSEVLNATVRAAREPGVTLELSPDAKETATGGPVGGPPGFDGS